MPLDISSITGWFFYFGRKKTHSNKDPTKNAVAVTELSNIVWNKLRINLFPPFFYFKNGLYLDHLWETSQSQGSPI